MLVVSPGLPPLIDRDHLLRSSRRAPRLRGPLFAKDLPNVIGNLFGTSVVTPGEFFLNGDDRLQAQQKGFGARGRKCAEREKEIRAPSLTRRVPVRGVRSCVLCLFGRSFVNFRSISTSPSGGLLGSFGIDRGKYRTCRDLAVA